MTVDHPSLEADLQVAPQPSAPMGRRSWAVWLWAATACVLLGASGAVRAVQERRHEFEKSYKESCPIDLTKLPEKFNGWELIKGGERQLDADTMKITGGTDHSLKTYANNLTGVFVTVLILYGPADPVLPHTPQVCYPASGFEVGEMPSIRVVKYPAGVDTEGRPVERKADFLAASYHKPNGRQNLREAVYHSFRLDGEWSPWIGKDRKFPRRNPGIFKVQIQRMVAEGESLSQGDPIEQFLGTFLGNLEEAIKRSASKPRVETAKPANGG